MFSWVIVLLCMYGVVCVMLCSEGVWKWLLLVGLLVIL